MGGGFTQEQVGPWGVMAGTEAEEDRVPWPPWSARLSPAPVGSRGFRVGLHTLCSRPLCRKIATYDEEIQRLYEEMEQQIKSEKEQFLLKVRVPSPGRAGREPPSWAPAPRASRAPLCSALCIYFGALVPFRHGT